MEPEEFRCCNGHINIRGGNLCGCYRAVNNDPSDSLPGGSTQLPASEYEAPSGYQAPTSAAPATTASTGYSGYSQTGTGYPSTQHELYFDTVLEPVSTTTTQSWSPDAQYTTGSQSNTSDVVASSQPESTGGYTSTSWPYPTQSGTQGYSGYSTTAGSSYTADQTGVSATAFYQQPAQSSYTRGQAADSSMSYYPQSGGRGLRHQKSVTFAPENEYQYHSPAVYSPSVNTEVDPSGDPSVEPEVGPEVYEESEPRRRRMRPGCGRCRNTAFCYYTDGNVGCDRCVQLKVGHQCSIWKEISKLGHGSRDSKKDRKDKDRHGGGSGSSRHDSSRHRSKHHLAGIS